MGTALEVLSHDETKRKSELVAVVKRGMATFVEVGKALAEIRDAKLYRDSHKTFEKFCDAEFSISRPRAYQLIDAATVVEDLSTKVDKTPATERQARAVAQAPPEKQAEVWEQAVEEADGEQPTAAQVEAVVEAYKPKKDKHGTPIPKHLDKYFAHDESFRRVHDALATAGGLILELGRSKMIPATDVQFIRTSLGNVSTKIKRSRPYLVCQKCDGKACGKCNQRGYTTEPTN